MSSVKTAADISTAWVKEVDRGGLIYVTHDTYLMFFSMEMEVRRHYVCTDKHVSCVISPQRVISAVCKDVDILYYSNLSIKLPNEDQKAELLKLIATKYITLRGFSFASSFMELYKQGSKKTTHKSKGLRKKLAKS